MNYTPTLIRDLLPSLGLVLGVLLVLLAIGWMVTTVWAECRAYGHSVLYCLRMVGR